MHFLWSQCQIAFEQHGGIMMTMFFAGLSGGMSHCAGMCGPFVMMQVTQKMNNINAKTINMCTRLRGASLLPYHMGRLTTYTTIGTVSAYLTSNMVEQISFKWLSFSLLITAAMMMLYSVFAKNTPKNIPKVGSTSKDISKKNLLAGNSSLNKDCTLSLKISKKTNFSFLKFRFLKNLFKNPTGIKGYILGIILGFIPCGLVYSAIMVVSATGNVTVAIIGMVIFSISTIPGLLLVGLGASFAPVNMPIIGKYFVPSLMVLSFLTLIYIAGGLLK